MNSYKENNNVELVNAICDILKESLSKLRYFTKRNLKQIGTFIQVFIPHVCMLGICKLGFSFIWVIIPFILYYITYVIKNLSEVYNRRTKDNIPVPFKRFTEEVDGEVIVDNVRLQEMVLYVNDVENELERLGKL